VIDFRYHALSLIAVLAALAIGLLLGVAIGDQGLVSGAERALREDVEERVQEARDEAAGLREELARRDTYEERTLPALVGDRLRGRRIAVIFLHDPQRDAFVPVRDALQAAGAELASVSALREPVDIEALAEAAKGTRYERMASDEALVDQFAHRVGSQIVGGGRLVRVVRRALLASSSGRLDGAEGVVLVRGHPEEGADVPDAFIDSFVRGLQAFGTRAVGVELSSQEPSQIAWYEERDLPSVDNVDETSGRASLVFALAGAADGAYGQKGTADSLVPEALSGG
jgi:hypothetical protein